MDRGGPNTRVVLVAPLAPPTGGVATWTRILLDALVHHPNVHTTHINSAALIADRNLRPTWLQQLEGATRAVRDTLWALAALLRSRPHLIHIATTAGWGSIKDLCIGRLARSMGVRVVLHYHDSKIADGLGGPLVKRAGGSALGSADMVVVLDGRSLDLLASQVEATRLRLYPNMVDVSSLQRILARSPRLNGEAGPVRILYVGALLERKGLKELVEACTAIPGVELRLVGKGAPEFQSRLREMSRRRGDGEWLMFEGGLARPQALETIAACDLLVLPSWWDLFPLSVLEGMAMGKPVVVSDQGALPQMIGADSARPCGLCVPARDGAALGRALTELVQDRTLRDAMGAAGLARARALYDAPHVTAQLVEDWTALSHQPAGSRGGSRR